MELIWRKLGIMFKSNMLYFAVSLPILLVYNLASWFALAVMFPNHTASLHTLLVCTVLLAILWGTGPVSCGYTYIMRNSAREEHVFLVSDFFEKTKENFKTGLFMLIADIAMLFIGSIAFRFYFLLLQNGHGFAKIIIALLIFAAMIYTFMHYYVYELAVTFENNLRTTLKNAVIMAAATLPMNLFLTIAVVMLTYCVCGFLTPLAIIIIAFFIWLSLMRFAIDFYSARVIKRKLIDTKNTEE